MLGVPFEDESSREPTCAGPRFRRQKSGGSRSLQLYMDPSCGTPRENAGPTVSYEHCAQLQSAAYLEIM